MSEPTALRVSPVSVTMPVEPSEMAPPLVVQPSASVTCWAQWVLAPRGWPEERPAPKELPSYQFTLLQVYGSLFFAAAKNLEEMLPTVDNTTRAVAALGLRGSPEVGSTFITVLQRYAAALQARDSRLMLVGIDQAVRAQLAKTWVLNLIGDENVFLATPQLGEAMNQAAAAAYAWLGQSPDDSAAVDPALLDPE